MAASQHPEQYIYIYGFCLSCYGAFFFGTIGYIDHAHYLTIFLALLAPHGAVRVLLASSTIWMHEGAAFTCLPLYFTIEWLHFGRRSEALANLTLSLTSFIIIHTFLQTVSTSVIEQYNVSFLAHADYKPRFSYLNVFKENFTGGRFRAHTYHIVPLGKSVEATKDYAIYCLLLSCLLAQNYATLKKGWHSAASALLIWLAAALPLAMGFFAWDTNRWIFLALVNGAVLFVVFQKQMNIAGRISFIVASFIIFFSGNIQLFDRHHYRSIHEFIPFLQNFGTFVTSIPEL